MLLAQCTSSFREPNKRAVFLASWLDTILIKVSFLGGGLKQLFLICTIFSESSQINKSVNWYILTKTHCMARNEFFYSKEEETYWFQWPLVTLWHLNLRFIKHTIFRAKNHPPNTEKLLSLLTLCSFLWHHQQTTLWLPFPNYFIIKYMTIR